MFFCLIDVNFLLSNLHFVENHAYSQKFLYHKNQDRRKKNILSSSVPEAGISVYTDMKLISVSCPAHKAALQKA